MSPVNRYKQLLASVPKGSFYSSDGQILPFRSSPYQLRITTDKATSENAVYLNDVPAGVVTTDADKVAVVNLLLVRGENHIKLVNNETGSITSSYVTTRDYATNFAGVAEVIEGIDTGIEQVLADSRLATSSAALIESVFGRPVGSPNDMFYMLETYRELLQEVRSAYRYFGGTVEGMSRVARAYTQISPLVYGGKFGPTWDLGSDILYNRSDRTVYLGAGANLPGSQGTGASISVVGVDGEAFPGTYTFNVDGTTSPKRMRFSSPFGVFGAYVDINANGDYSLSDGQFVPDVIGEAGSYTITAGANDKLTIEIGNVGRLVITLTAGIRTAAQICADINAAVLADPRYGAAFGSPAVVHGTTSIAITSISNRVSTIHETVGSADAAQTLFNLPSVRGGLSVGYSTGATSLVLSASTNIDAWPTPSVDHPLSVVVGRTTFQPVGSTLTAAVLTTRELVKVVSINRATKTLTLQSGLVNNQNAGVSVELDGQLPYARTLRHGVRNITVRVGDLTKLPVTNVTETFAVNGTGLYDGWLLTNGAGATTSSAVGVKRAYFDIGRDIPFSVGPDSVISIKIPDDVIEYHGFNVRLSVHGCQSDPATATPTTVSQLGFSWDNQSTYHMYAPAVSGAYIKSTNQPKQYAIDTRVGSGISVPLVKPTQIWARIKLTNGTGSFDVHRIRLTIPVTHSGLHLGDGTIPRNSSKVKQGALLYVWCKDPLTNTEQKQLGVLTSTQDKTGHLDTISPSNLWLDKFNASIYSSGSALNVHGATNDADFVAGVSENLDLVLRTPSRYSYLSPSITSEREETVVFSASGPHVCTLTYLSDQDITKAVLFENGIPLHKDEWQFNSANVIEKLSLPNTTAKYTFRYNALIRFASGNIDLGAAYQDYIWFADYHIWLRPEIKSMPVVVNTGLQFDANSIATLSEQSNQDQSTGSLLEDTGLSKRILSNTNWSFVDGSRVRIDQSVFNPSAIYSLTYTALADMVNTQATAKVELRSAATAAGLSSATWAAIDHNTIVDNGYRFHQMRATIYGVRDQRDVRLQSLLLKGLNAFGVNGTIPVLRP